jgi:hypothetical protein
MAIALRTHVDVVITALESALATPSVEVYRGVGPTDPLEAAPYVVVYSGSLITDGPMSAPWSDAMAEIQVTAVARQADQAEWVADQVFAALIGQPLPPPSGRAWLRPGAPAGHELTRPVTRDQDFGEGAFLFYVVSVFSLPSTPA